MKMTYKKSIILAALAMTIMFQCQCARKASPVCKVQPGNYLDVTRPFTNPEGEWGVEGRASYPPTKIRSPYPLEVYVSRLNRKQYKSRQKIIYDVTLKNITDESVMIPWSPVAILTKDRPSVGYRHGGFEAMVVNEEGDEHVVTRFVLFGSPKVPNSLKEVRPQECVTIRIPGYLFETGLESNYKFFKTDLVVLAFKVGFWMHVPEDRSFDTEVFSKNQLAIKIKNELKYR
jgi:hypothetical protein